LSESTSTAAVTYYGANWCGDCVRSNSFLDGAGVEYVERNVEDSAELAAEAEAIAGRKNLPVIVFADGEFLVEPSNAALESALAARNLI
jgi:glutaredoxin